jgi:hypothetical protein
LLRALVGILFDEQITHCVDGVFIAVPRERCHSYPLNVFICRLQSCLQKFKDWYDRSGLDSICYRLVVSLSAGGLLLFSTGTLLASLFDPLAFLTSGRPIGEVPVDIIDGPIVTRLCHCDCVDVGWGRCIVFALVGSDRRCELPHTLLKFVYGVIGS